MSEPVCDGCQSPICVCDNIKEHRRSKGDELENKFIEEAKRYITPQRLDSVKSKLNSNPEFTELRNAFKKDAVTEFLGDYPKIKEKKNSGQVFSQFNKTPNSFRSNIWKQIQYNFSMIGFNNSFSHFEIFLILS